MSKLANPMQAPRITKVTVNIGVGEGGNRLLLAERVLKLVTGQDPVRTLSKKTNRDLGTREGAPIGCKVTLRNDRMYEFLDRLISVAFPRVRDFRGVSPRAFDGRGNFSVGLKEQIVFPEIDYDKVDAIRGMDITITTTARTNEEGEALLRGFNFPLRK